METLEKQIDLYGHKANESKKTGNASLYKSCLQKYIRRGNLEKSMWFANKLLDEAGSWSTWKRLLTIAVEDCGLAEAILVTDSLYRQFMAMKREQDKTENEPSWEMRRAVTCAARILASSPKNRMADEFCEWLQTTKEATDDEEVKTKIAELDKIDDYCLDMHTLAGRKRGRGLEFWYQVSSQVTNPTDEYKAWSSWFKPLHLRLAREKRIKE